MWKRFQALPTWVKTVVILLALAAIGGVIDALDGEEPATPAPVVVAKPAKSLGERVFPSTLVGYTESDDGRILVSFEAWRMTKESVDGDVRRFMSELTRDRAKVWKTATISAVATFNDNYGKSYKDVVLTYTFQREEAMKVVSWDKANLIAVGLREYVVPQLR